MKILRTLLCGLCNGCRAVKYSDQIGPVMLCAHKPENICNLQTYRGTSVMKDALRPIR